MVCREVERPDIGTHERTLGLARLVQANKYLNNYPNAGITALRFEQIRPYFPEQSRHIVMPPLPRKTDNVGIA
jgi:hypothetical protein